jgi:acetyl-CoA carboxylase carboxyltransferase component
MEKEIEKLNKKLKELEKPEYVEKQHQKGKLTARERINLLFDPDTFVELDPFVESRSEYLKLKYKEEKFPGDAVITGFGKINGRQVFVFSQDFSKIGGTLGEMHGEKIAKVYKLARENGCPIIGIYDSGGARIQEGIFSLQGYAKIFREQVLASGVIPQIAVMVGPSAGGACYAPGLSDFIFMVEGISFMFITGPDVIKKVLGEEISFEDLGGAKVHFQKSGCAHFIFKTEEECFLGVKKLLSYLPQNNLENPPRKIGVFSEFFEKEESFKLLEILPKEEEKGYEMREVIKEIFDRGSFFEIQEGFAQNAIVGFARLAGYVVGIVANQPKILAGVLDIDSSDKISRFVRFCDCFNIPIINLVDTPGYLPGKRTRIWRNNQTWGKSFVCLCRGYCSKNFSDFEKGLWWSLHCFGFKEIGLRFCFAWPTAQIFVMGPEQAVKIIYKKEIEESKDPKKFEEEKIKEFKENLFGCF